MKTLPKNVTATKKTPEFDELIIPKGLLNKHQTKAGVWGKIVILSGQLQYTINQPEILHEVKPLGKVRFYVEFYE